MFLETGDEIMRKIYFILLLIIHVSCTFNNQEVDKKQSFISILGKFPDRSNVDVEIIKEKKYEQYTRKTLQYTVLDDTIETYLLIPNGLTVKVPGILAIHQDGGDRPYQFGKGEPAGVHGDPELKYGLELCLRGYVVICPDRFPFESRMLKKSKFQEMFYSYPIAMEFKEYGKMKRVDLTEDLYRGAKASYYLVNGMTMMGVQLSELMFAIDYLTSLDEVDKNKIGVIGHSAGGLYASILMFLDDRIKVGVSSCGTTLIKNIYNPDYLRPMNGFCGSFAIPNFVKWGDFDDILTGIYPRTFLETSADISREDVFQKAFERYKQGGKRNKIKHIFYDAKAHIFREDMRNLSYDWFDQWLK
jgi:dienelactone hydrolase